VAALATRIAAKEASALSAESRRQQVLRLIHTATAPGILIAFKREVFCLDCPGAGPDPPGARPGPEGVGPGQGPGQHQGGPNAYLQGRATDASDRPLGSAPGSALPGPI
jgi:hypothetical protein